MSIIDATRKRLKLGALAWTLRRPAMLVCIVIALGGAASPRDKAKQRLAEIREAASAAQADDPSDPSMKPLLKTLDALDLAADGKIDAAVAAMPADRETLISFLANTGDFDDAIAVASSAPNIVIGPPGFARTSFAMILRAAARADDSKAVDRVAAAARKRLDADFGPNPTQAQRNQENALLSADRAAMEVANSTLDQLRAIASVLGEPRPGAPINAMNATGAKAALPKAVSEIKESDVASMAVAAHVMNMLGDFKGASAMLDRIDRSDRKSAADPVELILLGAACGRHVTPADALAAAKQRGQPAIFVETDMASAAAKSGNAADAKQLVGDILAQPITRGIKPDPLALAVILAKAGDTKQATELFNRALEEQPTAPTANSAAIDAPKNARTFYVARQEWEAGLKEQPSALLDPVMSKLKAGVTADPAKYFDFYQQFSDGIELLLEMKRLPDAQTALEFALKLPVPPNREIEAQNATAMFRKQLARALIEQGKLDAAAKLALDCKTGDRSGLIDQVVIAACHEGKLGIAGSLANTALEPFEYNQSITPARPVALIEYAEAALKSGDKASAVAAASSCLKYWAGVQYAMDAPVARVVAVLFDAGGPDAVEKATTGEESIAPRYSKLIVHRLAIARLAESRNVEAARRLANEIPGKEKQKCDKGLSLAKVALAEFAVGDRAGFDRDARRAMRESDEVGFCSAYDVIAPLADALEAGGDSDAGLRLRSDAIHLILSESDIDQVVGGLCRIINQTFDSKGAKLAIAIAKMPEKPRIRAKCLSTLATYMEQKLVQGQ